MRTYVPVRKKAEEAKAAADSVMERLAAQDQKIEELTKRLESFFKSQRRVKRDGQGNPVAIEIVLPEGEVFSTQSIERENGRVARVK